MWNNQKQQKIVFPICQTYKPTIIFKLDFQKLDQR